jgi:hypothetical protein
MDVTILIGGLIALVILGIAALGWGSDTSALGDLRQAGRRNAENTP